MRKCRRLRELAFHDCKIPLISWLGNTTAPESNLPNFQMEVNFAGTPHLTQSKKLISVNEGDPVDADLVMGN
jgi:hypothetical protein